MHDSTACPTPSVEGLGAMNCSGAYISRRIEALDVCDVVVPEVGPPIYLIDRSEVLKVIEDSQSSQDQESHQ